MYTTGVVETYFKCANAMPLPNIFSFLHCTKILLVGSYYTFGWNWCSLMQQPHNTFCFLEDHNILFSLKIAALIQLYAQIQYYIIRQDPATSQQHLCFTSSQYSVTGRGLVKIRGVTVGVGEVVHSRGCFCLFVFSPANMPQAHCSARWPKVLMRLTVTYFQRMRQE